MKTDKTKLLQDIEDMKVKLASMEKELNKVEDFKHFPSIGDEYYYYYTSIGVLYSNNAADDGVRVNTYKTEKEAQEACNKAFAIEKVKRRIIELQGDWRPDWTDGSEEKYCIQYAHKRRSFISISWNTIQQNISIPYMKDERIAGLIVNEMEDELKFIFGIA